MREKKVKKDNNTKVKYDPIPEQLVANCVMRGKIRVTALSLAAAAMSLLLYDSVSPPHTAKAILVIGEWRSF